MGLLVLLRLGLREGVSLGASVLVIQLFPCLLPWFVVGFTVGEIDRGSPKMTLFIVGNCVGPRVGASEEPCQDRSIIFNKSFYKF